MTDVRRLSADAARRIALAAQGFARPRPSGRVDRRHLRQVIERIGLIQIDSVNVLVRSQELPLWSRLGAHPRSLLPAAVADGELFETWDHEASIVPSADLPLLRWRMAHAGSGDGWRGIGKRTDLLDSVRRQVRERGPLAVGDLDGRVRNPGTWWDWDDSKVAIEHLFAVGELGARRRPNDFARLYDLLERVVPAEHHAAPAVDERTARKELLLRGARHHGIGTLADIADYHRMRVPASRPLADELVAEGRLIPVTVDGWKQPAFLDPDAATPRRAGGTALLSPFDSLIWFRDRTERLFDFTYRLEIYTPAPKRVYGYYVLPFLLDGRLVGRVDLKADRAAGMLRVQAAHVEPDLDTAVDRPRVAEALTDELRLMAGWLGLDDVGVVDRGTLAADLRRRGLAAISAASPR